MPELCKMIATLFDSSKNAKEGPWAFIEKYNVTFFVSLFHSWHSYIEPGKTDRKTTYFLGTLFPDNLVYPANMHQIGFFMILHAEYTNRPLIEEILETSLTTNRSIFEKFFRHDHIGTLQEAP